MVKLSADYGNVLSIEVRKGDDWSAHRIVDLSKAQERDITYRQMSIAFARCRDIAIREFESGYFDRDDDKPYPASFALGLVGFEIYLSGTKRADLRIRIYVEDQRSATLYRIQGFSSISEAEGFGDSLATMLDG